MFATSLPSPLVSCSVLKVPVISCQLLPRSQEFDSFATDVSLNVLVCSTVAVATLDP